jgi:hypothetical protein
MTRLGLLQEVSLNLFEKRMRLNLYHKDAFNKKTSKPLEDDFDKPSTMPTSRSHWRTLWRTKAAASLLGRSTLLGRNIPLGRRTPLSRSIRWAAALAGPQHIAGPPTTSSISWCCSSKR